jgi:hypothetical protein
MLRKKYYFITWLYSVCISVLLACLIATFYSLWQEGAGWKLSFITDYLFWQALLVLTFTIPFSLPAVMLFIIITSNFQYFLMQKENYIYVIVIGLLSVCVGFLTVYIVLGINMLGADFWTVGAADLLAIIISIVLSRRYFLSREAITILSQTPKSAMP